MEAKADGLLPLPFPKAILQLLNHHRVADTIYDNLKYCKRP